MMQPRGVLNLAPNFLHIFMEMYDEDDVPARFPPHMMVLIKRLDRYSELDLGPQILVSRNFQRLREDSVQHQEDELTLSEEEAEVEFAEAA